jgi:hypothetical protein
MIKFLKRLFRRKPTVLPSGHDNQLRALRLELNRARRDNEWLRENARKIDVLAYAASANAAMTAAKFRLIKNNYVNFKLNAAQMLAYIEQPKLLKQLPDKMQRDIGFMVEVLRQDGAVDPELLGRDAIARINRGEFKMRELQPLLDIGPDYQSEADKIAKLMQMPAPDPLDPPIL